jgi:hypothetical protein
MQVIKPWVIIPRRGGIEIRLLSIFCFQKFLHRCYGRLPSNSPDIVDVFIRLGENVFTELLLGNGRILSYRISTAPYATILTGLLQNSI